MNLAKPSSRTSDRESQAGERGWALLGLILAMSIMGIMLGALVPNVQFQVRRDKEAELLYRGAQMAKAIAMYYNNGKSGGVLNVWQCRQQPRGCLTELQKLKEPYLVGVNEIKLVRISATIDPMDSGEWEPVRLRDPRLMTVFQAYAAETNLVVPQVYLNMAGPPTPVFRPPSDPSTPPPTNPQGGDPGDPVDPPDPFASFSDDNSGPGPSNLPIVGVAPKIKGPSVRTLYGLDRYEQWVFIFIPPINNNLGGGGGGGGDGTK